ncbi:Putative ATP-grasp fold succinyl-CoA synthetase-type [[Torrubiella] hemipterigena]|uniref:ATP citrate synthase n=1 Tax=[Torrubiella] hemipterigena TaxID=1531966 RepID=A0A0A1T127_9HYPO|nr:Putative ATP-grasp fold succinyl-CoA synthetase-type [[Torrubiella] hemipterigena]
MSAKSIFEADGKAILNYHLTRAPAIKPSPLPVPTKHNAAPRLAHLTFPEDANVEDVLNQAEVTYPWLLQAGAKFVAKPDQLIKRRGKSGLLALNKTWPEAKAWVAERAGKEQKVEHTSGVLRHFLVEPFVPHPQDTEYYININSVRDGDWILFTHEGGVDVGDVDAKAEKILIPVDLSEFPSHEQLAATLLKKVPSGVHNVLVDFIMRLYAVYVDCQFTYLEINPLVVIPNEDKTSAEVHFLDLAAKLDQTADFECGVKWAIARSPAALGLTNVASANGEKVNIDAGPPMDFPAPFGRELTKEEAYIADLDAKTGASLKLTVLNPAGRIWTLVAGGGASVVYADAIASAGFADDLANYGEYSGAPTESQTYHYARTVLDLMLRAPMSDKGKVLFIGGGIANFTNVASTFKGVIRALRDFSAQLIEHNVQIWVRRAGPNYQEGLKNMKAATQELGLNAKIFGPEMHVSGIVPLALIPGKWESSNIEEFKA